MRQDTESKTGIDRERAISTAIDATLALVIVSVSVSLLAVNVSDSQSQGPEQDPIWADQTAETLLSATVTTEYSIRPVASQPEFTAGNVGDTTAYTRTVHGTPADLLADAAVSNAGFYNPRLWDNTGRLTMAGQLYQEALEEPVYVRMLPAESNFNVTAVWRPYKNASIVGTATSGETPPSNVDVHSVTTTIHSGMAPIKPTASRDFQAWGDAIARSIIRGYFPERASQLALEQRGLERELIVYRYKRFETFVDSDVHLGTRTTPDDPLNRSTANSTEANDRLTDALSDRITTELADTYSDPSDVNEAVQVSEVKLVVRVWDE